jgi:hypothetical protein
VSKSSVNPPIDRREEIVGLLPFALITPRQRLVAAAEGFRLCSWRDRPASTVKRFVPSHPRIGGLFVVLPVPTLKLNLIGHCRDGLN